MQRSLLVIAMLVAAAGTSGQTIVDSIDVGGTYRNFRVHLPPGFASAEHPPLVLNLHGLGSNAEQQELYSEMNAVADTARFLVCYPNGINNSWNLGLGPVDEIGFFNGLIDSLQVWYNVDLDRVYSCGMSQGGFMSFRLACTMYDRIAAIASVAGSMAPGLDLFCTPDRPVPVLMMNGTADGIVPYTGGLQNIPVESAIAFWVAHNGCTASPDTIPVPDVVTWDFCTAVRIQHEGCEEGSAVVLYRIDGGGHTWPGAGIPLGVTNQDFEGSVAIWEFFRNRTIHGMVGLGELPVVPVFALHPVPYTGQVMLSHPGGAPAQVTVVNALGQVVHTVALSAGNSLPFDTEAWEPGLHVWIIRTGDRREVLRGMR